MAPAALPLAKIGSLLIKTLSKPVAKRIKTDFTRYGLTRRFLVGMGQSTHQLTTRMTIWSEGFKVRSIPPLEENEAITKGADLLGEAIVFGVSVGVVVWEYNRSNEKAKAKEEKRLLEIEAENDEMDEMLHALDVRIEALEKAVKAQNHSLLYSGQRYVEPPKEALKLIPVPRKLKQKQNGNGNGDSNGVTYGDNGQSTSESFGTNERAEDTLHTHNNAAIATEERESNNKIMFHVGANESTGNPGRLVALEDLVGGLEKGLSGRIIEEDDDFGGDDEAKKKKSGRWGAWWPF
uniref:OPA3-like protein n=1 Tax=Minutocellus polymorphus TaxID=265543 RepID=A0A6U0KJX9_9STRA|mmetsp:Transcript_5245/g.8913  ORF Transcript_5245/g.8913 Transcript_5245/m.8913 type:complete len:293 (+) Transcript_5245:73-951(+)